jgi:hypothetical protein
MKTGGKSRLEKGSKAVKLKIEGRFFGHFRSKKSRKTDTNREKNEKITKFHDGFSISSVDCK